MKDGFGELMTALIGLGGMLFSWVAYSGKQQKEATEKLEVRIEALESKLEILKAEREKMLLEIHSLRFENMQLKEKMEVLKE